MANRCHIAVFIGAKIRFLGHIVLNYHKKEKNINKHLALTLYIATFVPTICLSFGGLSDVFTNNKLNTKMLKKERKFVGGGSSYLAPEVEVLEISVEQGFALSNGYGEEGEAGGDLGDDNYGDF